MLFADARLGDTVDVSQLIEERDRAIALHRVRQQLYPERPRIPGAANARPGATECASCGDPIGAARLAALPAATRCTDCQSSLEARKPK